MYSLMFRISESKNYFVNAIYESDIFLRSCLFHTWEEALNMNKFLTVYNVHDYLYTLYTLFITKKKTKH